MQGNKALGATIVVAVLWAVSAPVREAKANTGTCQKNRITNIHYTCVSPGAACGAGCECKDVTGGGIVKWRDCKCKKVPKGPKGTIVVKAGRWLATVIDGALAENSTATLELLADAGNEMTVYDQFDVMNDVACPPPFDPQDDCDVIDEADARFLTGPSDYTGTIELTFGSGPPDAIPVEITALSLSIATFSDLNPCGSTAPIQIQSDSGAPSSVGSFDSLSVRIQIDSPTPVIYSQLCAGTQRDGRGRIWLASATPSGPAVSTAGPTNQELLTTVELDVDPDVPAVSVHTLTGLALLVLVAGTVVLKRARRTASV